MADENDDWVKLVSSDGYAFLIKRSVAMMSGTLKNMLNFDSSFKEALANTCPISERAPVVEKVCEYMSFKAHYEGPGSKEDIPINEFTERIPPEIALELYVCIDADLSPTKFKFCSPESTSVLVILDSLLRITLKFDALSDLVVAPDEN